MSLAVALPVLFAAALHALWNTLLKGGKDKALDAGLVACAAALLSIPLLPFVPIPRPEAWPYLLISALLQFAYFRLIAAAYQVADIGLVYPIMRGCAPLLVMAASGLVLGEELQVAAIVGIGLISVGVLALALDRHAQSIGGVCIAVATACVIAAYTFVDGVGARSSGSAISYALWMSLLPAVLLMSFGFLSRGSTAVTQHLRKHWGRGIIGGASSLLAYGIALWAMTKAPIAIVAALRETSIVFAFVFSAIVLREPFRYIRLFSACIIAMGAFVLRL